MAKHRLRPDSEVQVRDFDPILAHSTIVTIRSIFLVVEQRFTSDDRTSGGFFLAVSEEIREISFTERCSEYSPWAGPRYANFATLRSN
jgi:hypothetical protein